MELSTADIAGATGGQLHGPDVVVDGASIDSRAVAPRALFVPIVAVRDGHDFIDAALEAGASAYLTARSPGAGSCVVVEDTLAALEDLGRIARSRIDDHAVVGITGSVGKTTVKDLLASMLSRAYLTAASPGNFNNELGVPLTLVNAPVDAEAVIVEMGARGAGHIADLCAVARPRVGVVTRVAAAHTEVFGTLDDIALAKGELVAALPADGTVVLNNEDDRVAAMATRFNGVSVIRYGAGGDVVAEDVTFDDELRPSFTLRTPWWTGHVKVGVRGLHQVSNTLAAAAAASSFSTSLDDMAEGLETATLSLGRMHLIHLPSGARVIDDAYNANPASVTAALDALAAMFATRRTAVLGVMAELGPDADAEHEAVGGHARAAGIRLIAVDAPAYGGEQAADIEDAVALLGDLGAGDVVLVKGSRIAALERVISLLEG